MQALKEDLQSSGVVAQLVEHLLCKQGVVSSSLISSTRIIKKSPVWAIFIFSYEYPFVEMGNAVYVLEILDRFVLLYPRERAINLHNSSNNEPLL